MIALFLDECVSDTRAARQLRMAGHSMFLPVELGTDGWDDEPQLQEAHERQALFVTANIRHFAPLHERWQELGRAHSGILQAPQQPDPGWWVARLDRAGRLLDPLLAKNQLLDFHLFESEESAQAYADSLRR